MKRELAIVVGCGAIGSAVACELHSEAFDVVLIDRLDPPCPYRGMTFTDAWFFGTAELDARNACFCASVRSIPTVVQRRMIAATTWSWRGVVTALGADVLVDTRTGKTPRAPRESFPGEEDPLVSTALDQAHLITGLNTDRPRRTVVSSAFDPRDEPCRHRSIVLAQGAGRVSTHSQIGDAVVAGELVATVGIDPIVAPVAGVIRGLPARGARLRSGDVALDIDPAGDRPSCFRTEDRIRALAEKVVGELRTALALRAADNSARDRASVEAADA